MAKKKSEIEAEEKSVEIAEKKFSKSALIASAEFVRFKDLLNVLLRDGEMYAVSEVKEIANNYLNKEV